MTLPEVDTDKMKKTMRIDWFVITMSLVGAGGGAGFTQAITQEDLKFKTEVAAQQSRQDAEIYNLDARMTRYEARVERELGEIKLILKDVQAFMRDGK